MCPYLVQYFCSTPILVVFLLKFMSNQTFCNHRIGDLTAILKKKFPVNLWSPVPKYNLIFHMQRQCGILLLQWNSNACDGKNYIISTQIYSEIGFLSLYLDSKHDLKNEVFHSCSVYSTKMENCTMHTKIQWVLLSHGNSKYFSQTVKSI